MNKQTITRPQQVNTLRRYFEETRFPNWFENTNTHQSSDKAAVCTWELTMDTPALKIVKVTTVTAAWEQHEEMIFVAEPQN
jgi:hypothetical protein